MFNDKYILIETKTVGQDERVDAILSASDSTLVDCYNKSLLINKSKLRRYYIEASLLCESDLVKISSILEVPIELLEFYQEFFFDTRNLDKLGKIEHIESIEDENEKQLKLWALGQKMEFISWRLGNKVNLSPIEGLVDMFSTAVYKSKEAIYSSNTSDSSREAIKWTKLSTDIARLVKLWTMDNSGAKTDLEIAIKEIIPDFIGIDTLLEENKNG
jgi:hypothetical protein